jgi:hypothetical protein
MSGSAGVTSYGGTVLPAPPGDRSWFVRARGIAADLLIATALIWALPLILGIAVAIAGLLAAMV